MAIVEISTPGDILGTITAGFNFGTAQANAVAAIAADQSPAGLQLKAELAAILTPFVSIITRLDKLLGIKVDEATPPAPLEPSK